MITYLDNPKSEQALRALSEAALSGQASALDQILNTYSKTDQLQLIQDSQDIVMSHLFHSCPKAIPSDPQNSHYLDTVKKVLFQSNNLNQDQQPLVDQYKAAYRAIRELEQARINILLPNELEKLESLYDRRYSNQTTYAYIKRERELAMSIQDGLGTLRRENVELVKELRDFTKIVESGDESWSEFMLTVNDLVYRIILLCDLALMTRGSNPLKETVSRGAVFALAPSYIALIVLESNPLIRQMAIPDGDNAINQPAELNLDVS